MKVWYLPIEAYTERYTAQLVGWTTSAFERNGVLFEVCAGDDLDNSGQIGNHGPLDFVKRPHYSATQVAALMRRWALSPPLPGDVVYFDDLFTPGFEAVPYYLDLNGLRGKVSIFARNHAGTADIYDYVYPSRRWMRHYEAMAAAACERVICASTIHRELMAQQGITNVEVLGLPFDAHEVRTRHPKVHRDDRVDRVLFASRWDWEKQPEKFIELAARARRERAGFDDWEFAVATGKKTLTSNRPELVAMAREAEAAGLIKIYEGLSKADYYRLVATSAVQFNCALQDFVSYTLLEASAFGTPTVAPCFRSFPEALFGNPSALYTPWDLDEALDKIMIAAERVNDHDVTAPAHYHTEMLDRLCTLFSMTSQRSLEPSATPAV